MKIRNLKYKILITAAMLGYAAALYLARIYCVISWLTGYRCPGCGMTRALLCALRLDFPAAFGYHSMFWSVPVLYISFLLDGNIFPKKWQNILLHGVIVIGFAANWVLQPYY